MLPLLAGQCSCRRPIDFIILIFEAFHYLGETIIVFGKYSKVDTFFADDIIDLCNPGIERWVSTVNWRRY